MRHSDDARNDATAWANHVHFFLTWTDAGSKLGEDDAAKAGICRAIFKGIVMGRTPVARHADRHLILFAACAAGVLSRPSPGIDRFWATTNSGNWNVPGNWSPSGVPQAADRVSIAPQGPPGTWSVFLDVNPTIDALIVGGIGGTQTLSLSGHTINLAGPDVSTVNSNGVFQENSTGGGLLSNASGSAFINRGLFTFFVEGASAIQGPFRNEVGGLIQIMTGSSVNCTINMSDLFTSSNFINNGMIQMSANFGVSATLNVNTGSLINNGTIESQLNGANSMRNINAALVNNGVLLINDSCTINPPSANLSNAGQITINAGTLTLSLTGVESLNNTNTITVNPGGTLAFSGGIFTNSQPGQLNVTGGVTTSNTVTSNAGAMTLSGPWTSTSASFSNQAPGLITLSSSISTTNATVSNLGTINLLASGNIAPTGGMFNNSLAGTIKGVGTLTTSGTSFSNNATISPGDPAGAAGTLHVSGPYTQSNSGKLVVDINGAAQFDLLQISGAASLAGSLNVSLGNGFFPPVTSAFSFLTAGSVSGTFGVAYFPGFPDGRYMTVSYGPSGATVTVQLLSELVDFDPGPNIGLPGTPTDGVLADFDADGDPDLAITITNGTGSPGSVVILLNAGTIGGVWQGFTSTSQVTVGVNPVALAAGKLDANNSFDLAVVNQGNGVANGTVTILANTGSGNFATLGAPITVGVKPSDVAAANFHSLSQAGGQIDLAVTNIGSNPVANGTLIVLINQGNGTYIPNAPVPGGIMPIHVDPGDVDNDRDVDIVVCNADSNTAGVYMNSGGGAFGAPTNYAVGSKPTDLAVVSLNPDSLPEIVTVNKNDGTVSVLLNNPGAPGTFTAGATVTVGSNPRSITALDADGDGDADIAVLADESGQAKVQVLRNDTAAAPGSPIVLAQSNSETVGTGAIVVLSGNLDGLNADDLVTVNTGVGLKDGGIAVAPSVSPLLNASVPAPVGFNIDLGSAMSGTPGFGAPSASFGAAAGQPGTWNNFIGMTSVTIPLLNLAGGTTAVTLTRNSASGGDFGFNNANTSGDFQLLLDDGQRFATPSKTYTFNNLPAGRYRVFTYAIAPDSTTFHTNVSVSGSSSANPQSIGGAMPVNGFAAGVTHAVHNVIVQSGSPLTITAAVGVTNATVNGIQLLARPPCPADISPAGGNDFVNVDDLLAVINTWGACPSPCSALCTADVNRNCAVNVDDLLMVINSWGACP